MHFWKKMAALLQILRRYSFPGRVDREQEFVLLLIAEMAQMSKD